MSPDDLSFGASLLPETPRWAVSAGAASLMVGRVGAARILMRAEFLRRLDEAGARVRCGSRSRIAV